MRHSVKMEISFIPTPDVAAILNALLDKFENRAQRTPALVRLKPHGARERVEMEAEGTFNAARPVRIILDDLDLPSYFSQIDPQARIIGNQQLQTLEQQGLLQLKWLPGETNHILHSISLKTEHIIPERSAVDLPRSTEHAPHLTQHKSLYRLLNREPLSSYRAQLESLLLAEKFRYPKEDWRADALNYILGQLRAGKSPSPFSLTDSNLNLDLLAVLAALPTLTTETPYRVFSVRIFNNSKRFEDIKPALVRLVRLAKPEWKSFTSEDLLRELNLVANPDYVHLAGNWELTDLNGQISNLDCFIPSVGFPASQISRLEKIAIRAEAVLCIENLTSFHAFTRANEIHSAKLHPEGHLHPLAPYARTGVVQVPVSRRNAVICLMGNPSPSIRHLLRLIPAETPIYLWSDMDYGGFNILSQLRRQVGLRIQPYLMDIATFDKYAHLSRPLTQVDILNLKRLVLNPALKDVHPTIEHILQRGLKLEQEAIQI
ncbi:MAG: Wadjet anti-phage system protein JetD domain-containing protein [Anaerolineales bacterium]